MQNIPEVKLGIVAVSRDCFPITLSEKRRAAITENETVKNRSRTHRTHFRTGYAFLRSPRRGFRKTNGSPTPRITVSAAA